MLYDEYLQGSSPFMRHLGTEVLALAHAFAHVVLSSSSFFPLPIHACVFTRMWSVGPPTESVGSVVVCATLWQEGNKNKRVLFVISVVLPSSYQPRTIGRGCICTRKSRCLRGRRLPQHTYSSTSWYKRTTCRNSTKGADEFKFCFSPCCGLWFPSHPDHHDQSDRHRKKH